MSYKSELQANNVDLQNILSAVNSLSGGSSAQTYNVCTVTVYGEGRQVKNVQYTKVVDGKLQHTIESADTWVSSITITDVLCGSIVSFQTSNISYGSSTGECELFFWDNRIPAVLGRAPTTPGGTGGLYYVD